MTWTQADIDQHHERIKRGEAAEQVTEADARAHLQGKAVQRKGEEGQDVALAWLKARYARVCPIETGWTIVRSGGKIVSAIPKEKVDGDFTCVEPGTGRSVLVEVKRRAHTRLVYSDIPNHQREALTAHSEAGGLSLLLWVHRGKLKCYDWAELLRDGFEPGASITWR